MSLRERRRAVLVEHIKRLRQDVEAAVDRLIDVHLETYHPSASDLVAHAERLSIKVGTWSERQKRSTYSQHPLE